jgi:predicted O-methyltransferase YrrM
MAAGLSLPPDSRLVGIDTFAGDGTGAHNLAAMAPEFVELCANSVREYVQLKNDISAELIKNTSEEAVKLFKDESADMVFVDAAHDYDAAKKDMEIWWHKVKQGGLLFGHDYHVAHKGVRAAVIEFAANNNVEFTSPKKTTIWMIRKP